MTNKQHPTQFDWATELLDAEGHVTLSEQEAHEIGARLRRQHSENETLQAGYAAARLEIESLRMRSVAPRPLTAEERTVLDAAVLDGVEIVHGGRVEPAGEYPALPDAAGVVVEHVPVGGGWVRHERRQSYTADQMRAYVDADRAAHAPADSVTAPAGGEIDRLRAALVYVAFALHGKPQYMLAEGIALIDGDTVRVSRDGWTVEASVNPARATPAARAADSVLEDAADPLQGAANWLAEAHGQFSPVVLSGCLMIGYNRAKRLHDAAIAARKQGASHD